MDFPINTYTYYAHCARMLQKANQDLQTVQRYLDVKSPNYYPNYLAQLRQLQQAGDTPELAQKIVTAEANFKVAQQTEQNARALVERFAPVLLNSVGLSVWEAPPAKQSEYRYMLDTETCQMQTVDWQALIQACQQWGMPLPLSQTPASSVLQGGEIVLNAPEQTDALRVWNHSVRVEGVTIKDERQYEVAHRDGIQLIPPPVYQTQTDATGKTIRVKVADQMAGTVLDNVVVRQCRIQAPFAPLQGIFMSDGLSRNLTVMDNHISVKGSHAISVAGMLSGTIANNTVCEVMIGSTPILPRIRLYPLRIGGNMADDGLICVLGFSAGSSMGYGTVAESNNQCLRLNGVYEPLAVEDFRYSMPSEFVRIGIGLTQFDYDAYLRDYSTWTLADFKQRDAWGYVQLCTWLRCRVQEYSTGQLMPNSPLSAPTLEQRDPKAFGVFDLLQKAHLALQNPSSTLLATRLVELVETPIRSFAMKRIAIQHGSVMPLHDLGTVNAQRNAMLQWLIPEVHLMQAQAIPA